MIDTIGGCERLFADALVQLKCRKKRNPVLRTGTKGNEKRSFILDKARRCNPPRLSSAASHLTPDRQDRQDRRLW
jgi:hypothetical protein